MEYLFMVLFCVYYDHDILQCRYRLAQSCMLDIAIVMRITYMARITYS